MLNWRVYDFWAISIGQIAFVRGEIFRSGLYFWETWVDCVNFTFRLVTTTHVFPLGPL
jgi:hypothetical protein